MRSRNKDPRSQELVVGQFILPIQFLVRTEVKEVKFEVRVVQTYANDIEVDAQSKSEALEKAKVIFESPSDDFFSCSAINHVKTEFHIIKK